jgi:hypothetical protein
MKIKYSKICETQLKQYRKNAHIKNGKLWVGGVAQVVEHLPSRSRALSLNPNAAKKKKKERKKEKRTDMTSIRNETGTRYHYRLKYFLDLTLIRLN